MEEELALLIDPDSFEALLESQKYAPLLEGSSKRELAINLAIDFTDRLQHEFRLSDKSWVADAIEDAKRPFIAIVARRYQKLLSNIVE